MAREPVILIHGYSDKGESFKIWRKALIKRGYAVKEVPVCGYQSLTNEVTIKDIAEGFDRALRVLPGLEDDQPFNAIVHSTGMLVLRTWLASYAQRRGRLKRLVALAPATFGSPLAHKGRGYLGAIFKGNKQIGPDFLEAGDLILDGLELGSRYTWDLAHTDLLGAPPHFGRGSDTPYVFIFCGTAGYPGIRQLVNDPGTDGTVRWAGCALNTQKFTVDFSRDPAPSGNRVKSTNISGEGALDMPFWPIADKNHGTIVSDPGDVLIDLVHNALQVDDEQKFIAWRDFAKTVTESARPKQEWQQFVVRAADERGDPITDYHVDLFLRNSNEETDLEFDFDVHAYGADRSFRCFHVNLTKLRDTIKKSGGGILYARIIASSGSALVGYHGINSEKLLKDTQTMNPEGLWDAQIQLPMEVDGTGVKLFYPFTTTFLELRLNRDPLPFGEKVSGLVEWAHLKWEESDLDSRS